MRDLIAQVRSESPVLREKTCIAAARVAVPFLFYTPQTFKVLQALFLGWRESKKPINLCTLELLREISRRVGLLEPTGWSSSRVAKNDGYSEPIDYALEIEAELAKNISFLVERHRIECELDSTMELVWLDILLFASVSDHRYLTEILVRIDRFGDHANELATLRLLDELFGATTLVQEYLAAKAARGNALGMKFYAGCLLARRGKFALSKFPIGNVGRSIYLEKVFQLVAFQLGDEDFWWIATHVVRHHEPMDFETFEYIAHGLLRISRQTVDLSISGSTYGGRLEVTIRPKQALAACKTRLLSDSGLRFLEAVYSTRSIRDAETNLWAKFGFESGIESINLLLVQCREQFQTISRLLMLVQWMVLRLPSEDVDLDGELP